MTFFLNWNSDIIIWTKQPILVVAFKLTCTVEQAIALIII